MSRYSPRARLTNSSSTSVVANWFGNQFVQLPANSFDSIATTTVGSGGASTVTFSSIPSTYQHLQIRYVSETDSASNYNYMRFNSDTGTNYSNHFLWGQGASNAFSSGTSNDTNIYGGRTYNGNNTYWGAGIIDIFDYANTNKNKTVKIISGDDVDGTSGLPILISALWRSTSAITTIELRPQVSGNFRQYSKFALYGIKAA